MDRATQSTPNSGAPAATHSQYKSALLPQLNEKYHTVSCNAFTWANETDGLFERAHDLLKVFNNDDYKFYKELYPIPIPKATVNWNCTQIFAGTVMSFMQAFDNPGHLCIIYYAGHSRAGEGIEQAPVWLS
jgi:hypothetical protein